MRFGKSAAEAAEEPGRGGSGGDFIKYLKDGDTTFRILQEPDDWTYYWEHFNPVGFSFPCPRAADDPIEDCPGCSSDIEKMKKVSRKIAFNVLQGYNGQDYVNVYKISSTLADKFKNRYARQSTITDRDYTITKFKTSGDRVDFDVEASLPSPVDISKYELKNIEEMLAESYNEQWGTPEATRESQANLAQVSREAEVATKVRGLTVAPRPQEVQPADPPSEPAAQREASESRNYNDDPAMTGTKRPTIAPSPKVQPKDPPSEPAAQRETEVKEEDLRRMTFEEIMALVEKEVDTMPPTTVRTTDQVVDWLMNSQ